MASTYLSRTISSGGNRKIMTFSAWIKRATASATSSVFTTGTGSERDMILFESDGKLQFSRYNSSYVYMLKTNRQFRDVNAWYHLMCVLDTTQGTSSNRMKIYVNGVQETSFNTANYPSQDYQSNYNQDTFTQYLGQDSDGNFDFNGCMSHVHYVDGTAYTPSTFGSTDATTGEWKINTSPTVTYGTNGFFLLRNDNAVTDRSGQGNNFAVGAGTLTKTEDCPSNVFATLSPLYKNTTNDTILANGNTDGSCRDNTKAGTYTTLGMPSGKFYCEVKIREFQNAGEAVVGVTGRPQGDVHQNKNVGDTTQSAAYRTNGQSEINATTASYGNSYDAGDIIGIAIDVDNSKLYFSKNGTWQNSGDPTSGSTGTGALSMPVAASACEEGAYFFGFGSTSTASSSAHKFSFNFGNGFFASTAVSSAGTNASNNGIFEYDVPTGYTALSTKGLNL